VTARLALGGGGRFVSAIVCGIAQGAPEPVEAPQQRTAYRLVVVPAPRLPTKRSRSRAPLQESVPEEIADAQDPANRR
jgi:hypothetical protein